MAKKVILGTDIARDAFKVKVNENFTELYNKDVALGEQIDNLAGKVIFESGTNDNGTYVKFADGTMICYTNGTKGRHTVDFADSENTKVSGLYYISIDLVMPSTFISYVTIIPYHARMDGGVSDNEILFGNRGGSSSNNRVTLYNTSKLTKSFLFYFAIGRWKA